MPAGRKAVRTVNSQPRVPGGDTRPHHGAAHELAAEYERQLVGMLLIDPSCITAIAAEASVADFLDPSLQAAFGRALSMHEASQPVTVVTLKDALAQRGELMLSDAELADLDYCADSSVLAVNYARRVHELALERRVRALCSRIAANGVDPNTSEEISRLLEELASPRDAECFQTITADAFARDAYPDSIVEGLIYRGNVANNCGASKAGKSWQALQRAACIAAGFPFLGLPVRRARVLYVSLEMTVAVIRERLLKISRSTGVPMPEVGSEWFQVIGGAPGLGLLMPELDLTTDAGTAVLRRTIERHRSEYVVIDTLYNALGGADPNSNAEMGQVFRRIRAIAHDTGAAFELLDHVAKGERSGPTSQAAIGAGVKGGAVATVLETRRIRADAKGWAWELHAESWFETLAEPITYRRPLLTDGSLGYGCERTNAADARGFSYEVVRDLFRTHGERDERGRPRFGSKRKLMAALQAAGLCGPASQDAAETAARAIRAEYAADETDVGAWTAGCPIVTRKEGTADNSPVSFTWRVPDGG
jgi:hypothetical protein